MVEVKMRENQERHAGGIQSDLLHPAQQRPPVAGGARVNDDAGPAVIQQQGVRPSKKSARAGDGKSLEQKRLVHSSSTHHSGSCPATAPCRAWLHRQSRCSGIASTAESNARSTTSCVPPGR